VVWWFGGVDAAAVGKLQWPLLMRAGIAGEIARVWWDNVGVRVAIGHVSWHCGIKLVISELIARLNFPCGLPGIYHMHTISFTNWT
jgi:hypothetical protein